MFFNFGGYMVINELIEKALSVLNSNMDVFEMHHTDDDAELYKQELASKIILLFRTCFSILALFARNNLHNQDLVYNRNIRILMNYSNINLG
jgi:hypothetical protein